MFGQAIADVLPMAFGMAANPVALIVVISMLVSPKARSNGLAFAIGWIVALSLTVGLVVLLTSPDDISGEDGESTSTLSVILLLLGLGLLFLSYSTWKKRPRAGETPKTPKWMASLDQATTPVALGLGAALSSIYPKCLAFNIATGTMIARADLSSGEAIVSIVVYVLLSSIVVGGPVIWLLASARRAEARLATWKVWLTANNKAVTAVVLLVFGVLLASNGLGGLID